MDVLGALFLALGAFFCLAAAVGVVRFPDVMTRMHAATKPSVFGLILVLLGVLMLIGVVVNAAILIVDKMAQHIQAGVSRREAMLTAMAEEFRPVLMVVLASGLGMLPMAIGRGIGSENRAGIGTAAARRLLALMRGESVAESAIDLGCELRLRESA